MRHLTEEALARLIAQVHEAAIGLASWSTVGAALGKALDCTRTTFLYGPADGTSFVDLMDGARVDAEFARYRRLDPSLPVSVAIAAHRLDLKEVAQVFEMVPERVFRRSEYYADYARRAGTYHRMGFSGIRGGPRMAPFAVHRPEDAAPFEETHRRFVLRLKPHIKQALALQERLQLDRAAIDQGLAAFDGHAAPVMIVDTDLRLVRLNGTAESLLGGPDSPLRIVAEGPGPAACTLVRSVLKAYRRADGQVLHRLVRAVAVEGRRPGPRRFATAETAGPGVAVSVVPVAARLMDGGRLPGAMPGLAMIVLTDLRRAEPPASAALRDMFGLSPAEAAVARALASGATADTVAAARGVTRQTVRTQIRTVLHKVGASGLRDLERILTLVPRAADN